MTPTRFSALFLLAALILSSSYGEGGVYTPDELLALTKSRNGDVLSAELAIQEAEGHLLTAKGAGRPSVDLDAHVSYIANPSDAVVVSAGSFGSLPPMPPTTTTPTPLPSQDVTVLDAGDPLYLSAGINLNQVLWSWGKVQGAVALYEAERSLAATQAQRAEANAAVQLYRSLYALRTQRELLAIVEEQERLSRQMLDSIAALRDGGVITSLDYEDAVLKVEGFSRTAASLRVSIANLERDIAVLAGIDTSGPYAISTKELAAEPRLEARALEDWRLKGKTENLDLAVAARAAGMSSASYELAKRQSAGKPDIGANLQVGMAGSIPFNPDAWEDDDIEWFLNLTVVMKGNLLDFGSSAGSVAAAKAGADKSLTALDNAKERIDSSVSSLYASLESLRGDLEFARRRASWSEAKLADQTAKRGAGSIGDLELLEARTDYLTGVMDFNKKEMEYTDSVLVFLGVVAPESLVSGEACR